MTQYHLGGVTNVYTISWCVRIWGWVKVKDNVKGLVHRQFPVDHLPQEALSASYIFQKLYVEHYAYKYATERASSGKFKAFLWHAWLYNTHSDNISFWCQNEIRGRKDLKVRNLASEILVYHFHLKRNRTVNYEWWHSDTLLWCAATVISDHVLMKRYKEFSLCL